MLIACNLAFHALNIAAPDLHAQSPEIAELSGDETKLISQGWEYVYPDAATNTELDEWIDRLPQTATAGVAIPEPLKRSATDWRPVEIPYNPPAPERSAGEADSNPTRTVWLRVQLPAFAYDEQATLFVAGIDQIVDVFSAPSGDQGDQDESLRRIYRAGEIDPASGAVRFAGYPWHLLPLSASDSGRALYFRVRSSHINIGVLGEPVLGPRSAHLVRIVRKDFSRVLVAIIMLFSGALLLALYIWNRKQNLFFAFGLTCLTTGGYIFTRTFVKQILIDAPVGWIGTELICFFAMPVGLYLYFEFLLGAGPYQFLRRGWQVQLAYSAIAFIACAAGLVNMLDTLLPAQVLFVVCLVSVTGRALVAAIGGNKDARVAGVGIALATCFAVYDVLVATGIIVAATAASGAILAHYGALLFVLSLVVILIRKIAVTSSMLDRTSKYLSRVIQELDDTVERRTLALQESRDEIEKISEVARQVNATVKLDEILDQVFEYFKQEFNIEAVILQFVDPKTSELYSYKTTAPANATDAMIEYSRKLRVPLTTEGGGILFRTYERKRPFYLAKVDDRAFPGGTDREIIDTLELTSFLLVPLLIQNEVIAIALFTSYNHRLTLSREDINQVSRFCDQIAGAIHHSNLLRAVEEERKKSDNLLLNILPEAIADELRVHGNVEPMFYESVSVLFTDIKGFTRIAETMAPQELVHELDQLFEQFDLICQKYGIEKLKTIGDAYMCAGGLPAGNRTHPVDAVLAALEIQAFMKQTGELTRQVSGKDFYQLRIGIHSGPAMAGIIGKHKFAYDVWGDAVNVASRMETNGEAGRVNISRDVYEIVKYFFECEYRGKMEVKNRGELDMYFVNCIRAPLSIDGEGRVPNDKFNLVYEKLRAGRKIRFRSEVQN
ncbi:MAG: GAF domain-containing protein [bacterium]|nr:GAF domain-containing protein [bacterium]